MGNANASTKIITGEDMDRDRRSKIDDLQLNPRLAQWKKARREAVFEVCVEREKIAMASWKETEKEDLEIRRAKLFKAVLQGAPIAILDYDVIVGRVSKGILTTATQSDSCGDYIPGLWENRDALDFTMTIKGSLSKEDREVLRESAKYFHNQSAAAHVKDAWRKVVGTWVDDIEEARLRDPLLSAGFFPGTVNALLWDKVLARGLRGFIDEARSKIKWFTETNQSDIDKLYFWQSSVIVCEAAIAYANRYAKLAAAMAEKEKNKARKKELMEMAAVCKRVPEKPARTFHEALQSIHFILLCKNLEQPTYPPNLGRADQYLWSYFKKDIDEGHLTLERASELLAMAIGHWGTHTFVANADFKESHQVTFQINLINVGGLDKNGNDASNLLSYLILHVIGQLKLSAPSIGFQWHDKSPRWLLEKAIDTNIKTKGGIPLFENSDHIAKCYGCEGIPMEEARNWYGLGCVTPVIPNRVEHNGSEGLGSVNIPAILDIALHNGVSAITGKRDPRKFKTFEELYDAFKKQHEYIIGRVLWLGSIARKENPKYLRFPFHSTVIAEGCMAHGEDLMVGNPEYHTFILSDRGIVDTADSLFAVKYIVYDNKELTMDELMTAIDENFKGKKGEDIRQMCLAAPKFGNDIEEVDRLVHDVGVFSANVIKSHDNRPFRRYNVSREGLSWHYYGGLGVGALPNGRKSLEPLNDGSLSPMRGRDKKGPTGVLKSALTAEFSESLASALNQKFSTSLLKSPESKAKIIALTETFLRQGGQHIQYNLLDKKELLDAKLHPEDHRDLVVRIGGFSAYFVELSPEIQDDVINRSEQGL